MKRQRLLRHLREHGCIVLRDRGDHTVVRNPANNRQSAVPRHREVERDLARRICKQLDIPPPVGD